MQKNYLTFICIDKFLPRPGKRKEKEEQEEEKEEEEDNAIKIKKRKLRQLYSTQISNHKCRLFHKAELIFQHF